MPCNPEDKCDPFHALSWQVCSYLKTGCGPIVTLDYNLISGMGIIKQLQFGAGDSLERFPHILGSAPPGQFPSNG